MNIAALAGPAGIAESQLLDEARRRRPRAFRNHEAIAVVAGGTTFLVAAVAFAALTRWGRPFDAAVFVGLTLGFAVLTQLELEVASGSAVPTQLLFVPMLFLLPLPVVPLAVMAAYLCGGVYEAARRRRHPLRIAGLVGCCWYALPPVLVLFVAGRSESPAWHLWPIYVAAFAAQCAGDFAHSAMHERVAHGIRPRRMLTPLARVYAFDALLAPVALLTAMAALHNPLAALALIPLAAILAVLAGERSTRVEAQLHAGQMETIANRDPLTQLRNRRQLLADIDEALAEPTPSLLAILDLDGFKDLNDRFGHLAGDSLLSRVGNRLNTICEDNGARAYRLGGDEFCVLSPLPELVEEFLDNCVAALTEAGDDVHITASYGAAFMPDEAKTATAALHLADTRLNREKMTRYAIRARPDALLLQTLHEREPGLGPHSNSVAELAHEIGQRLGLSHEELANLRQAALLHDIGTIAIPDQILHKTGPLTADERSIIEGHTLIGERILNASPALTPLAAIVRSTHEAWDGSGYPDKIAGDAIPLAARIIAVCEAFDAITNDRPYRRKASVAHARQELAREAGRQFDPAIVEIFLGLGVIADAAA